MIRHFLDIRDIDATALREIINYAKLLKSKQVGDESTQTLKHKTLAMIFEKSSTRTRVSFEAGMYELGGHALHLPASDLQIGRGETIADTARVLSCMVDVIMMRANSHDSLAELAKYADVPVINGLTDQCHPCQIMADILTIEEHLGDIQSKKIAWIGDGNNVAQSLIAASVKFGFELVLACPSELQPSSDYVSWAKQQSTGTVSYADNALAAASDADVVVTDTWVSMGDADAKRRMALLAPFQVTSDVMAKAKENAIFMHCLPAHRGEEVTAEVIDGKQSVIWDEAENRKHVQKAILHWCVEGW